MKTFQIRECQNPVCGLRYPMVEGHPFGRRCPACLGETRLVLEQPMEEEGEPGPTRARQAGPSVLLDNLRSTWNVGSILRTADGLGFAHAFLCGITPSPESAQVQKTSLGAEKTVSWSRHPDGFRLVKKLKDENFYILGLETGEKSTSLIDWKALGDMESTQMVLVLGSEVAGIDPDILKAADELICLPMSGKKQSFNVAVAFGIAAYQLSLSSE